MAARRAAGARGKTPSASRGWAWRGRNSWPGFSWLARGGGEDGFQSLQGAEVPLLGSLLRDAQLPGRLGRGELLEVAQRQHLAVDRVHDVEGLAQPRLHLGT